MHHFLIYRDRRVPFVHWLPMLGVGIICTGVLLWQTTGNISLITGYLAVVASFLYADYLDNRGRTDSVGLVVYYQKASIFYYLALVLVLPALSWFVFMPSVNYPADSLVRHVCRDFILYFIHGIPWHVR